MFTQTRALPVLSIKGHAGGMSFATPPVSSAGTLSCPLSCPGREFMSNLRDSAAHDGDSTTNTTHAINSPHVARGTTRTLLKLVRAAQPISRADLARRLEVNRGTVTEIVKPLLAAGALRENSPEHTEPARAGRPPIG